MKTEKIVLSIETSLKQGSLALFRGNYEIGNWQGNEVVSRSEDLVIGIEQLCQKNDIKVQQLDLIVVSLGPGSFTGLRVGIAVGKGLALATSCQLVGVPILNVMAFYYFQKTNLDSKSQLFCVSGAGRGYVYYQIFMLEKGLIKVDTEIKIAPVISFLEEIAINKNTNNAIVISDANMKFDLININGLDGLGFEWVAIEEPFSKYLGYSALNSAFNSSVESVESFINVQNVTSNVTPIYVREV